MNYMTTEKPLKGLLGTDYDYSDLVSVELPEAKGSNVVAGDDVAHSS